MKFLHLSDLHIGKRVNEYSMLEDQKYILTKIINIIDEQLPDAVIIAGDVYDKSVPSAEAVELFDDFLVRLAQRKLSVFVISGNHDSPERIAFGARLMHNSGIYMSPVYNGSITPVHMADEYGTLNVWMLPFVKPAAVRKVCQDDSIESYNDAVKAAIERMPINKDERNILITHQFVTGAERTESEEIFVGGTDNVDVTVFDCFDYTALGHIHRAQSCKSDNVRYCGTPLKYSFSEAKDQKSVTLVELKQKGAVSVHVLPLTPLRDMVEIKGKYDEIMLRDFYKNTSWQEDYTHITLTDEDDIPDAIAKLRTVYHNLMKLDYDNLRTRSSNLIDAAENDQKSPVEYFSEFYELQNNQPMSKVQSEFIENLIADIWEAGK
ncbi:MAG: exonuclease SbcCD subunit D [Clostridia bacterium]|nr:exonuclease SbcCD subunit D [Clostridia bacterium]